MQSEGLIFRIPEVPDANCSLYRRMAGGDVRYQVNRGWQEFLRILSQFPDGAVSATILYVFTPRDARENMQDRLKMYLLAQAHQVEAGSTLELLIRRNGLNQFYRFEQTDRPIIPSDAINVVYDVVRRVDVLRPTLSTELNPAVPERYYVPRVLEPNEQNDHRALDRGLSGITETVVVAITLQPTDIEQDRLRFAQYAEQIHSINRPRNEGLEHSRAMDFLGAGGAQTYPAGDDLRPFRTRELMAESVSRRLQRFGEALQEPHFLFKIRVAAETEAAARLIAATLAESAFLNGSYRLIVTRRGDPAFEQPSAGAHTAEIQSGMAPDPVISGAAGREWLARISQIASAAELAGVFRLPVASTGSPCCIPKNTDPRPQPAEDLVIIGFDQEPRPLGLASKAEGQVRGIPFLQLPKHVFTSGASGQGKTTLLLAILLQLYERGVPFLVIEPTKTEYRSLKRLKDHSDANVRGLAHELQIYPAGNECVPLYRHNVLERPPGISENERIGDVLNVLRASVPLAGPLPAILGEALEECYDAAADLGRPPILADLITAAEAILTKRKYGAEVYSNLHGAIQSRLSVLTRRNTGRVFQSYRNVPSVDRLLKSFSIIELDRLSEDEACLQVLSLLVTIRERLKTLPNTSKGPRFCLVLEEAHVVVGTDTSAQASETNADPKAFAAQFVVRMLAELRALGVSIIVANQLAADVAPAVIAQTGTKITFRQVDLKNREAIGATMLQSALEIEETARLSTGEAYFYTEGLYAPRRLRTINLHETLDLSEMSDEELLLLIRDEEWFIDATRQRIGAELDLLTDRMNAFDSLYRRVGAKTKRLVAQPPRILRSVPARQQQREYARLANQAIGLKRRLGQAFREFRRESYVELMPSEGSIADGVSEIRVLRLALEKRFKQVLEPGVGACTRVLEALVNRCKAAIEAEEAKL